MPAPGVTRAAEPLGPLGDMPSATLRELLHRMADWAADWADFTGSGIDLSAMTALLQYAKSQIYKGASTSGG